MKNRFLRLIENLVELGDTVTVVTPDRNAPAIYAGAAVIGVHGFQLPFYPGACRAFPNPSSAFYL
jgi:sulfoquinovosyltransferase|tara:strand:+ start:541 stop:735 length:195 start_codon:yes stop_codon:yes gene_type:complete